MQSKDDVVKEVLGALSLDSIREWFSGRHDVSFLSCNQWACPVHEYLVSQVPGYRIEVLQNSVVMEFFRPPYTILTIGIPDLIQELIRRIDSGYRFPVEDNSRGGHDSVLVYGRDVVYVVDQIRGEVQREDA